MFAYLKYLLKHKWFVYKFGRQRGVGLWQLLIHDWTKFLPVELFAYQRYFHVDKQSNKQQFLVAWNHHQKHNPHHWEYWVLLKGGGGLTALEMPKKYVLEMLADWDSAGYCLKGRVETLEWYEDNKDKIIFNPETRKLVEGLLYGTTQA